ncbi:MAG: dockerin type I repeat-containing protein [Ignavibacteria bacterium]|nr:dockerin type I repeat-containing protein [Ignavibacteria bacterium]
MKNSIAVALLITALSASHIFPQNCVNTSVGFTPLSDLGAALFRGYTGGLYPGGSNSRPQIHEEAGVSLAKQIVPLDANGNYDPVSGKIVMLSIGMSNCNQEFGVFMSQVSASSSVNPKLKLVNGAQGGYHINLIIDSNNVYWANVLSLLSNAGVTSKQVQAVWYKNVDASPADTSFPGYSNGLRLKHKIVLNILKKKFANLRQCFIASRIYAGYATTGLSPEPNSYYSGWAVKWVVEDQISGDTSLTYKGSGSKSPWISWGPYLWADGTAPRSDGLTWNCPGDYNSDGTHPSVNGRTKVANMLMNFFMNDAATMPWFRRNLTIHLTTAPEGFLNLAGNNLSMRDTVRVYLRRIFSPYQTVDSCTGILDSASLTANLNFYNLTNGTYYMQVIHRNSTETWSRSGGEMMTLGGIIDYDMTASAGMAYGNNLILKGTKHCIYSGDVNGDGIIDASDLSAADNDASVFAAGYLRSDVNGDMTADAADLAIIDNNAFNNIQSIVP